MSKACMAVRCWEAWNTWAGENDKGGDLAKFARGCDWLCKAKKIRYRSWMIVFSDDSHLRVWWFNNEIQHEITKPIPAGQGVTIAPTKAAVDSIVDDIWLGPQAGYVEDL